MQMTILNGFLFSLIIIDLANYHHPYRFGFDNYNRGENMRSESASPIESVMIVKNRSNEKV